MHIESPFSNRRNRQQAGGVDMVSRVRAPLRRQRRDLALYGVAIASGLVLAILVFISVSAANADLYAKTAAAIDLDNGAVCTRLDFSPATPAYDRCVAELNDLRDRDRAMQQDVF